MTASGQDFGHWYNTDSRKFDPFLSSEAEQSRAKSQAALGRYAGKRRLAMMDAEG